ncbi:MAG: hypothetical protein JWM74_4166 [Myxococcaceae bacterium]|nr:hypothetical protein [Myxococcaceae bacterium]
MSQRNRGAVMLARNGKTQDVIASRLQKRGLKVSRVTVSHWLGGRRKPTTEKRPILRDEFGIPLKAWDKLPKAEDMLLSPSAPKKSAPTSSAVPPPAVLMTGARGKAEVLEQMANEWLESLRADALAEVPKLSFEERVTVAEKVSRIIVHLAKLTGELDISTRLLKLPIWAQVRRALTEGLRGHPDAVKALEKHLRAVEEEYDRAS